MRLYSAFLTEQQISDLKAKAIRDGLTVSELIRRAIDKSLGARKPRKRKATE